MSAINPLITFKAGMCELDTNSKPAKVKALPEPGYLYLYTEDELIFFCWRPRNKPIDEEPPLDLVMVPTDCRFVPYEPAGDRPTAKTNGRIFVLKFLSSSTRYLFWLQSAPQSTTGDPAWLSPRDKKIGAIVDQILQGENVDVGRELAEVRRAGTDDDDDETMDDAEPEDNNARRRPSASGGAGGAGADATGGDVRREGEDAREGGADGARAASGAGATDTTSIVQNFLNSLQSGGQQQQRQGKIYPMLSDLLDPATTISVIDAMDEAHADKLLDLLPATVLALAANDEFEGEATPAQAEAAKARISLAAKKDLLRQVLRSPQFQQSLGSLSMALRDGGLPSVAEALGVPVQNGGLVRGGSVPLGGGEAVEAFVEGVKKSVQEKKR